MKILFFAPHSAIWMHAFPEALVAESLMQNGHDLLYVGCGKQLKGYCVPLSAYGIPFGAKESKKNKICDICDKNKEIIKSQFKFNTIDITDLNDEESAVVADNLLSAVTPANWSDFQINGVNVGKIAAYELLIQHKKSTLIFDEREWERYCTSLKNCVIVLLAMQKLFSQHKPDRVVVYNALYAVNRTVCKLSELEGVPQYFLHAGNNMSRRLQTLFLSKGHMFDYYQYMVDKWSEFKDRPCSHQELKLVTDHFLEVIKGRSAWVYSSAPKGDTTNLKDYFGIEKGKKVLCALMGSHDENVAAETSGIEFRSKYSNDSFLTQVEWLKFLIDFARTRSEVFLIIRVHPREFPNKREAVLSEHAAILKTVFLELPENVKINWPTDDVSLYDLAKITALFANSWSSAGKEMALLGIPVMFYSDRYVGYPIDLNYIATSPREYEKKLEDALQKGWDPDLIRNTYRWCAMELGYGALDISESYSRSEYYDSMFAKVFNKIKKTLLPYNEQYLDVKRRNTRLVASEKINHVFKNELNSILDVDGYLTAHSYHEETTALKKEVARLVGALFFESSSTTQTALETSLRDYTRV